MHARKHRVRHALQLLDRGVQSADQQREAVLSLIGRKLELLGEVTDVAARHEVLACTLDDDATQALIRGQRGGVRHERVHHRRIKRVERVGTIERQRGDETVAGKQDGAGHGDAMRRRAAPTRANTGA